MKYFIYIICLALLVTGCSKSSVNIANPDEENPDSIGVEGTDGGVKLYFPQENMLCNLGTNITPTESTVNFEWKANGSDSYKVVVENVFTGNIIQQETTDDIIPIVLKRATPYKWYVESSKGSKSDHSATWQFYNAGPGEQTYAPFPTVINYPLMAATVNTASITLQWTGNDVDNDIAGFDIYLGTSSPPNIYSSEISSNQLDVTVNTGTIYYWNVITKDSEGNTSESGIYQFKVQ